MSATPAFRAATFRVRPYDLIGAAAAAQSAAEGFAGSAANTAQSNAELHADAVASAAQLAAQTYADGLASNYDASGSAAAAQAAAEAHADAAASAAQAAAIAHADGLASNYDASGSAAAAQAAAIAHADGLASNYDASGAAAAAQSAAQAYADQKVADLVGSAPAILDTLEEISNALGGDGNLAATLTASIAAKADQTAVDALTGRVEGVENALSPLEGRIAAEEEKTQAQDQALNVLVGSDGALDVETAPGSGVTFVYTGTYQE
jgi:hypothetical protein